MDKTFQFDGIRKIFHNLEIANYADSAVLVLSNTFTTLSEELSTKLSCLSYDGIINFIKATCINGLRDCAIKSVEEKIETCFDVNSFTETYKVKSNADDILRIIQCTLKSVITKAVEIHCGSASNITGDDILLVLENDDTFIVLFIGLGVA